MNKELELWHFIAERLNQNQPVMLLVVAESSGSSPGRQGHKMAVGQDGKLCSSIGGGVMEVNLVEQCREILAAAGDCGSPHISKGETTTSFLKPQIHKKNTANSSGMICSGKQTVIFRLLTSKNAETVRAIIEAIQKRSATSLTIGPDVFTLTKDAVEDFSFKKLSDTDFVFREKLGHKNELYIVGGGHCSLALSELMAKMDFYIHLFDDRPELNTIDKNRFAHKKDVIETYEQIGGLIPTGANIYVVVMTLGYKSDEIVIRHLLDKEFKYFGVLGSKAKMSTLLKSLRGEGFPAEKLDRIHTPIGLAINSRTPEEIAVSIAAEIIAVKNAD